jgi:hypothetical protein
MKKSRIWNYAGLLISLVLIVAAYFWATGSMNSLFAYRSPLKETPPAAGQPANAALTRRVVFVLVDALRLDTSLDPALMPVLNGLRGQGAVAVMHSRPPSYSEPGYTTLLTGAWPDINDGPPINLSYEEIPTFTQDDLFSAANRAGLKTAVSGYYWFEKLIPQAAVSASFYTPGEDAKADRQVVDAALPWLSDGSYQLTLIHIDQVDYAGHHEGGPRDPRWGQAAARADALIGEIVARLDLTQDTLLVLSDHGQVNQGGHGGNEPVTLIEPFILVGKGVRPGQYGDMQMVDVSPTLAVLLGVNLPASAEGRPLVNLFTLDEPAHVAIMGAFDTQQKALADAYRAAIGRTPPAWTDTTTGVAGVELARASRLAQERLPRTILAVLLALALGRLLIASGTDTPLRFLCAGVYLLIFNLGYVFVSARTYSLSTLGGVPDLLITGGGWALAAYLLAGALFIWRSHLLARERGERTAGSLRFTLTAAYLLLLPVLFSYALNGWLVQWSLPEFASAFVGLLSAVQVLVVSALGLLAAGVVGFLIKKT